MSTVTKVKLQPPYIMLRYVVNDYSITLGIWTYDELERDNLMKPINHSISFNPISLSSPRMKSPTKIANIDVVKPKKDVKNEKIKTKTKSDIDNELEKLIKAGKSNKNEDFLTDKEISALNDQKNSNYSSPVVTSDPMFNNSIPIIPKPLSLSKIEGQSHHFITKSNSNSCNNNNNNNKQTNELLSILKDNTTNDTNNVVSSVASSINTINSTTTTSARFTFGRPTSPITSTSGLGATNNNSQSLKHINTKQTSALALLSVLNSSTKPKQSLDPIQNIVEKSFDTSQAKKIAINSLFQTSLSLNNTTSPIVTTTPVKKNSNNHDMATLLSPQDLFSLNLNNNIIKNNEKIKTNRIDNDIKKSPVNNLLENRYSPISNNTSSPYDLISPSDLLRLMKK